MKHYLKNRKPSSISDYVTHQPSSVSSDVPGHPPPLSSTECLPSISTGPLESTVFYTQSTEFSEMSENTRGNAIEIDIDIDI